MSYVDFSNNLINAQMVMQIIEKLQITKSTFELDLQQNNLKSEGLLLLINFLKLNPNKILGLKIAYNNIGDEGFN